jgi:hypothetical protein
VLADTVNDEDLGGGNFTGVLGLACTSFCYYSLATFTDITQCPQTLSFLILFPEQLHPIQTVQLFLTIYSVQEVQHPQTVSFPSPSDDAKMSGLLLLSVSASSPIHLALPRAIPTMSQSSPSLHSVSLAFCIGAYPSREFRSPFGMTRRTGRDRR